MSSEKTDVKQLIAEIQEALDSNKSIEEVVATIHVVLLTSKHLREQLPTKLFVEEMRGWKSFLQEVIPLLKEFNAWKHREARGDAIHRAQLVHDIIDKRHPITETGAIQIVHDVYQGYRNVEVAVQNLVKQLTEKSSSPK